jgi:hypothetical protein
MRGYGPERSLVAVSPLHPFAEPRLLSEQRRDHGLRLLDIEHDDAADHTGAMCVWPGTCRDR